MTESTSPASGAPGQPVAKPRIARPPTAFQRYSDVAFKAATYAFGVAVIFVLASVVLAVMRQGGSAMSEYGFGFLTGSNWDANRAEFGILPEILGTLYTSFIALLIGGFFGVTVALVLSQGFLPRRAELVMKNVIELLAAIPSVVYGLWGIFVLIPLLRAPAGWLHDKLGFLPFFETRLSGPGILPASLVLAIMILPTVTAVSREALAAVPLRLAAAAYGLGATRWEGIFRVTLPTASGGIFGALVLGLGRAFGRNHGAPRCWPATLKPSAVAVFSREYAGRAARQFTSGGRSDRGRRLDVRRCRAARDHAGRERLGSVLMLRATRGLKGLG